MGKTNVIAIMNKKGGVGKTITSVSIPAILASAGKKVLVIDIDPQINLTFYYMEGNPDKTIADLFLHPDADIDFIRSCIYHTPYNNIDIIPGNKELDEISDFVLVNHSITEGHRVLTDIKAKTIFVKTFEKIQGDYDYIIIDNTPYFNLISKNCLAAANCILIPVEGDGHSFAGLIDLLNKINEVKSEANSTLDILGVFFVRGTKRSDFQEIQEMFRKEIGAKMLPHYIRQDVNVSGSASAFVPLPYYRPSTNATTDYLKLINSLGLLEGEGRDIVEAWLRENLERERKKEEKRLLAKKRN